MTEIFEQNQADLEFAVEGVSCAGVKIDMVGLHGNRTVTVDFNFPDEFIGVRQLGYGQTFHRLNELCWFLRKGI